MTHLLSFLAGAITLAVALALHSRRRLARVMREVEKDIAEEESRLRETLRPNMRAVQDVAESRYSFTVFDEATGEVRFEEYRGPAISSPGGVG